jgi:hypothetical protein
MPFRRWQSRPRALSSTCSSRLKMPPVECDIWYGEALSMLTTFTVHARQWTLCAPRDLRVGCSAADVWSTSQTQRPLPALPRFSLHHSVVRLPARPLAIGKRAEKSQQLKIGTGCHHAGTQHLRALSLFRPRGQIGPADARPSCTPSQKKMSIACLFRTKCRHK